MVSFNAALGRGPLNYFNRQFEIAHIETVRRACEVAQCGGGSEGIRGDLATVRGKLAYCLSRARRRVVMAQLTDDCFAFSGPLMSISEMERLIAERVTPVSEVERVGLREIRGRVVAYDIVAPINLPPFDNSAVDGYAVRHADLSAGGDTRLRIAGRLTAGDVADFAMQPGHAVRIFTGAPMPPGADTVFMQEDVRVDGDTVLLPSGLNRGANKRDAGEDVRVGAIALRAGTVMEPQHVALAAALGITDIDVRRRLKVAIFSTGNEVLEPGSRRQGAAIFDANRFLLAALLERLGADVTDLGIVPDDPKSVAVLLRESDRSCDLIVTSGGVSTGEADYVRDAVDRAGKLVFWRLAIKPGRPVAMGVLSGGTAFVGLPGNPVAVFVTFVCVVRLLFLRLAGARPRSLVPTAVFTSFAYKKKPGRREYVRVSLRKRSDGEIEAVKHPQDGAGILTSLTETDGLLEFQEDVTDVKAGDRVGFLPYSELLT